MTREAASDPWWRDAVVYQIYPRSFQDSNGDGVGDLEGIISRLDYLNDGTPDSLGVDAIWLSPIYPSPMKDHGYDISDYEGIDPLFGNLETFDRLLQACHNRGIRVIMDLVVNHTSDEHPWFRAAASGRDNDQHDWYLWQTPRRGLLRRPNNWLACFELRSAWWWQPQCEQYYLATFTRHQPELNWRNPAVKQAVFAMMQRWFDRGVDGFRLDVINYIIKDAQLRSNPWSSRAVPDLFQRHLYDRNRPESHDICREMRQLADAAGDKMLVGEIFSDDPGLAASYCGHQDELHMAFNFAFLHQPWSARSFKEAALNWYRLLAQRGWPCFTLSNHDQPRHFSRYDQDGYGAARARVAATMLLTLRGTPFLYFGEEIGMRQAHLPRSALQDPLGKKIPWMGRDGSRTPMQWDSGENAGFSDGTPWLPVAAGTANVTAQQQDKSSLLSLYRRLIWLRRQQVALRRGDIRFPSDTPPELLVYAREWRGQKLWIVLNFSAINVIWDEPEAAAWTRLFSSYDSPASPPCGDGISLRPHEALILSPPLTGIRRR
jgi:alpha-glucosidase